MPENQVKVVVSAEDQTREGFHSVQQGIESLNKGFETLKQVAEAFGAAEFVNHLVEIGQQAIETAANFDEMSKRTGVSVESLSTLSYAAQRSGVATEQFELGIKKLQTTLFNADAGLKLAVRSFAELGISIHDSNGILLSAHDALGLVADKFASMPDGTQKAALAVQLFGKSGTELIPMLDQGRAGLEALEQRAKDLGIALDSEATEAAERFKSALDDLKLKTEAQVNAFTQGMIPALTNVANAMLGPGATGLSGLKEEGKDVGDVFAKLAVSLQGIADTVIQLGTTLTEASKGVFAAEKSIYDSTNLNFKQAAKDADDAAAHFEAAKKAFNFQDDIGQALTKQFADFRNAALGLNTSPFASFDDTLQGLKDGKFNKQAAFPAAPDPNALKEYQAALVNLQNIEHDMFLAEADERQKAIDFYNTRIAQLEDIAKREPQLAAEADIAIVQARQDMASKIAQIDAKQFSDELKNSQLLASVLDAPVGKVLGPLSDLKKLHDQITASLELEKATEQQLTADAVSGGASRLFVEQALAKARGATAAQLAPMVAQYEKLAALAKDPALQAQAQRFDEQLSTLKSKANDLSQVIGANLKTQFTDAFASIISGANSAPQAFANMAKAIVNELAKIVAEMLVVKAVMAIIGFLNPAPSVADVNTAGLGSLPATPGFGVSPIPAHATGGHMQAGEFGVVGDAGPEVWNPDTGGTVIPMDKASGMFGGGDTYYQDFRGSDAGVLQKVQNMIRVSEERSVARAKFEIREMSMRRP